MDVRGRVQLQTALQSYLSCSLCVVDMKYCSMASACSTSSSPLVSAPSACPSSKKTAAATFRRRRRRTAVSCRATGGGGDNDGLLWLPRRDMMLNGLSGVAAGLAWYPGLASADDAKDQCPKGAEKVEDSMLRCDNDTAQKPCPLDRYPASSSATGKPPEPDTFVPASKVTRVRKAVHLLSPDEQERYKKAVARMKQLKPEHPLSFTAQAAIHQAYCDSYYKKYGESAAAAASSKADDGQVFDVHFSWLFAPWHRMYIYFYERALCELLEDTTFALPYWSWDVHDGMVVPALFRADKWTDKDGNKVKWKNSATGTEVDDNPLYDCNRNGTHLDKLMDLHDLGNPAELLFDAGSKDAPYMQLLDRNNSKIYKQQQVKGPKIPELYLGEKYCTGIKNDADKDNDRESAGLLESSAHTNVHVWVGRKSPGESLCTAANGGVPNHSGKAGEFNCNNDMGFLGTAANDPLFYSHHSNVDRMWHLWSECGGQGFADEDWLDTSFVFWDGVKNPRKVRVKVRDVLDTAKLGYTYAGTGGPLPWLDCELQSLGDDGKLTLQSLGTMARSLVVRQAPTKEEEFTPPVTLVQNQVVVVPAVAVPAKKDGEEQVLVIDGIVYNPQENNQFDVGINVPEDKALQVGPQYKQYAGSFSVVPGSGGATRRGKLSLCVTGVLADIGADKASAVRVVIVPRTKAKMTLNARPAIEIRNYSRA